MSKNDEAEEEESSPAVDLKPKPPPRLAPRGIKTFTVCRQKDETGVSGEGVVIEGVLLASGHCIIHWLYPPPRGGIALSCNGDSSVGPPLATALAGCCEPNVACGAALCEVCGLR